MSKDHIQKVLLETIDMLRIHIRDLKEENLALKKCIIKTIGSLQKQNESAQKHLDHIGDMSHDTKGQK